MCSTGRPLPLCRLGCIYTSKRINILAIVRLLMNSQLVMDTSPNSPRMQLHCQFIPVAGNLDSILVIDMPASRTCYGSLNELSQALRQERCIGNTLPGKLFQFLNLNQAKRPLHLCHAHVVPKHSMAVALFLTVTAQQAHTLSDFGIIGGHHATFTRGNILGGIK